MIATTCHRSDTPARSRPRATEESLVAKTMESKPPLKDRAQAALKGLPDQVQGSQAWNSIFRPGSIFRKGYNDSPRNRSYVIMNSVLYHLHPVKVKRHAVKVSYTLCLGGLSFFLFILLTSPAFLCLLRPRRGQAWDDITPADVGHLRPLCATCTDVGSPHVISVFLHMARVFYRGAYSRPASSTGHRRDLLTLTLLLSFNGTCCRGTSSPVAVTVGTNMMVTRPSSVTRSLVAGCGAEIGTDTLLRWYCCTCDAAV